MGRNPGKGSRRWWQSNYQMEENLHLIKTHHQINLKIQFDFDIEIGIWLQEQNIPMMDLSNYLGIIPDLDVVKCRTSEDILNRNYHCTTETEVINYRIFYIWSWELGKVGLQGLRRFEGKGWLLMWFWRQDHVFNIPSSFGLSITIRKRRFQYFLKKTQLKNNTRKVWTEAQKSK